MRKIKVRFVDLPDTYSIDCFGQKRIPALKLYFHQLLEKMYELDEQSDPDYVFTFVPVGNATGFDYSKYKDAVIVFCQNENIFPDFFCFDYVIGGDSILQYGDRYFYLPNEIYVDYSRQFHDRILTKHESVSNELAQRRFCSMVISNGTDAAKEREMFFHMLSQYKTVDSGGRFLNNIGGPVADKYTFEAAHKFTIAFDNIANGIIQEKISMAFAERTIPIYWGNPSVTEVYNEKAFVNCHAFESFEQVVERVKLIDNDDALYLSMLREPAYAGYAKPLAQWEAELCDFLRMIIEQPKEKAIKRRSENWMGTMQEMRANAFKRRNKKKKIRRTVKKLLLPAVMPMQIFLPKNGRLSRWLQVQIASQNLGKHR